MRSRAPWNLIPLLLVAVSCSDNALEPTGNDDDTLSGATAKLRVVNTLVDAGELDVLVADRVVLQSLAFGMPSAFVEIPAGDQAVGFRLAGSNLAPHTSSVPFAEGDSITLLTIDSSSIINPWVLTDTGSVVPPDKSKLRVAHFAASALAVDIWRTQPDWQQFITIMFPFRHQEASPYLQSDPGVWQVLVSTEQRQGGVPVLTDTLLLSDPIDVPAGESRTVIVLDREGGGLQAKVITP
ncbi:MAG: DUF4397 domain-containing protein [Gemmatimonadota bacterium]|nr:MAG: DUF4397 domain-containing protein [Gemmatimonadota bacterium]